jgi:peptide subunit release factor 1 (eRF1)
MRHVKRVAERLFGIQSENGMDCLMVGCRQEFWPDIEPHLHPYLKKSLIGRFNVDPGLVTPQQIQEMASALLTEIRLDEQQARVREVIGQAQRNGLGSLGLRHVITSFERGEVQTLLLGENFSARMVQCTHCGHMDTRIVEKCAVCEHETREIDDAADALIGMALRMGVQVLHVDDAEFAKAGNIGALLRFRADQNTAEKLAS